MNILRLKTLSFFKILLVFTETKFKKKLKSALRYNEVTTYNFFENVFLKVLNDMHPVKKDFKG